MILVLIDFTWGGTTRWTKMELMKIELNWLRLLKNKFSLSTLKLEILSRNIDSTSRHKERNRCSFTRDKMVFNSFSQTMKISLKCKLIQSFLLRHLSSFLKLTNLRTQFQVQELTSRKLGKLREKSRGRLRCKTVNASIKYLPRSRLIVTSNLWLSQETISSTNTLTQTSLELWLKKESIRLMSIW